jgi:hypothetical protein
MGLPFGEESNISINLDYLNIMMFRLGASGLS